MYRDQRSVGVAIARLVAETSAPGCSLTSPLARKACAMSFAACSAALLPQLLSSKCSNGTGAKLSTQAPRRCGALALHRKVHALTCSLSSESETGVSRRDALACGGLSAVLLAVKPDEAQAAYANRRGGGGGTIGEAGYDTFYGEAALWKRYEYARLACKWPRGVHESGLARPPASYGFSARTEPKLARYSFSYPSVSHCSVYRRPRPPFAQRKRACDMYCDLSLQNWEEEIIGKVEHGTGGIDSRVKGDGCKAFVVTVINEGMDTQSFDFLAPVYWAHCMLFMTWAMLTSVATCRANSVSALDERFQWHSGASGSAARLGHKLGESYKERKGLR
eukprot:scaffold1139_cov202-Prasinococcus_capsulatus_cf.AAC.10